MILFPRKRDEAVYVTYDYAYQEVL